MIQLSRLLLSCKDTSRLISDAMDRALPFHIRIRMRLHLLICALCQRYQQQLSLVRNVLRSSGAKLDDADRSEALSLSPEAKARIHRALDSHRP